MSEERIAQDRIDDPDPRQWQHSGLFRVVDGVYRLPLPIPLADLGSVNCYVLVDEGDVVLVDPGWDAPGTADAVERALSELGLDTGDVSTILITHTHWDHYSAAMRLRVRHGLELSIGEGERTSIDRWHATHEFHEAQSTRLLAAGAADLARTIRDLPLARHETGIDYEYPDRWLQHADRVRVGSRELTVFATPGHTRGHIVVADPSRGVLITGDHVLPRITPSIGYEIVPEEHPLESFLASLRLLADLPDALLLPAHGNVTSSVHARVTGLLQHHDERLAAIERRLRAGAGSATEIADGMRWTRRELTLDELAPTHRMLATLEVAAHLDVLTREDRAWAEPDGATLRYRALDG